MYTCVLGTNKSCPAQPSEQNNKYFISVAEKKNENEMCEKEVSLIRLFCGEPSAHQETIGCQTARAQLIKLIVTVIKRTDSW